MTGWVSAVFKELFARGYDYLTFLGASLRAGWPGALDIVPECLRAGVSCWIQPCFLPFPLVTFEKLRLSIAA